MAKTYDLTRWLGEVDDLALAATAAPAVQESAYVQALSILMRMRPGAEQVCAAASQRDRAVSGYVDAGACASAVLQLVPGRADVTTSQGSDGCHHASVRLAGQPSGTASVGKTFALALVGAVALSLVEEALTLV